MKYWKLKDDGRRAEGEIVLIDRDPDGDDDRVVSMHFSEGKVVFKEQCDEYFGIELSPDQAIEALQEAIKWIMENDES